MVVGVGRSGTSLAMQALVRLGAYVSEDVVPASANNVRGSYEAVAVRDHMIGLYSALGSFKALRPDDWLNMSVAQTMRKWIASYIRDLSEASGKSVAAIKFPLSSVFLPLWRNAAKETGTDLRIVWATRNAVDTYGSFRGAYGSDVDTAEQRYLQRSYYLLQDARREALLLPYEKWQDDAEGQMAALRRISGLPAGSYGAADLFEPSLNRGGSIEPSRAPAEAVRNFDAAVSGRRSTLWSAIGKDRGARDSYLREMAAALAEVAQRMEVEKRRASETAGRNRMTVTGKIPSDTSTTIAAEQRVKELSEEAARRARENADLQKKIGEGAEARDALAADLKEAKDEAQQLRQACSDLTQSRDRAEEDMAAAHAVLSVQIAEQTNKLKDLTERHAALRSEVKALRERDAARGKRIGELSRQAAAQKQCLDASRERDAARQKRLEGLAERKDALLTRIGELEEKKDAQKERIDELREKAAARRARLEEWRERGSSRQRRIEELKEENGARKKRVEDLRRMLAEREEASTAARSALSGKVAERKERIEALQSMLGVERKERANMVASTRWKAGELFAEARRRPGIRTLTLPIRLLMLGLRRSG